MFSKFATALVLIGGLLSSREPILLEYLPLAPVEQSSVLEIRISDHLPGLKFHVEAKQSLSALVSLKGNEAQMPRSAPPFDLSFMLKAMKMELKVNDKEVEVFTGNDPSTLQWAQVNRLKNRSISLNTEQTSTPTPNSADMILIFEELPSLRTLPITQILEEWFQPIFALAERPLTVGSTYEVPARLSDTPALFQYEIKSITDSAVLAHFDGKMALKELDLIHPSAQKGSPPAFASLALEGTVYGDILWNRENALVCQATVHYHFTGSLKMGETAWSLDLEVNHQLESTPKS